MRDQRHWGQGGELGLSCSHQGFDGDFSESWPSETAPQLGFKATKSPASSGVRTSGEHRAETPAWPHAGFSFPGEKRVLSRLFLQHFCLNGRGRFCFSSCILALCSWPRVLCAAPALTSSWPLTAGPLDFLTLLSAVHQLPCASLSLLPSVL